MIALSPCVTTDVREAIRGRESRSYCADIEAAEREDTSDHRQLYEAISRIRREGQKENSNVPEELSEKQTRQRGSTLGRSKFNHFICMYVL